MLPYKRWPFLAPEGEDGESGGSPEPTPPPSEVPKDDAPKVTLSAAELQKLKDDLAQARSFGDRLKQDEEKERKKRQKAQEENGEFKALAKSLQEERDQQAAELEKLQKRLVELTPKAQSYEAIEKDLKSAVAKRLEDETLPKFVRTAVDAASSLQAKANVLADFDAERGGAGTLPPPKNKPATPPGGPPPPDDNNQDFDFAAKVAEGEDLHKLIAANPEAWKKYTEKGSSSQPSGNAFTRALFGFKR